MEEEQLKSLIADAVNDVDLRPEEIPGIDLYLDQITSLVSEKLKQSSPCFHDRVLTKTMVNNYSKDGLLSPINGKKYSKEHFLQMLLVYSMKNTLSIGEIKRVLQSTYRDEGYSARELESLYSRFLDNKVYLREHAEEFADAYLDGVGLAPQRQQDLLLLILGFSCMSSYLKNAAQALLDAAYPQPAPERDKKRAREEAKEKKARRKNASEGEEKHATDQ